MMMKFKYEITSKNILKHQYYGTKDVPFYDIEKSIDSYTYVVSTKESCIKILIDFFDAPESKLDVDAAKKMFSHINVGEIKDETIWMNVCTYYNIRKDLFDETLCEIEKIDKLFEYHNVTYVTIRKDIPYEANHIDFHPEIKIDYPFGSEDNEESYIEVKVSKYE